ncbi:FadD3 family acyl-CoA ligase [Rhodococcus sp. X156]|uniref:FadD3 family acyl-CoA ligase n=1 Tax=Rhodococcus sp. X156 TaxID=2499145 RepID=UPI000FD93B59|nr:FadD3 family acyl-CoA ligase [Rhodococcus sp. X156]
MATDTGDGAVPTTPHALRRAAARWGGRTAVADVQPGQDVRLTWSELLEEVRSFAGALVGSGVQAGDRVAVWAPNTHHWIIAALGVHYAGATLIPVNTRYTGAETLDLVQRSHSVALVAAGTFLKSDRLAELRAAADGDLAAATELHTIVRVPLGAADAPVEGVLEWDDFLATGTDELRTQADGRADALTGDDIADILFTSGTTGRSKGVLATHQQGVTVGRLWGAIGDMAEDDRYLIASPFFHSYGYKAGILVCLYYGATMIPLSVYSPTAAMALIQDERATVFPGAPTIFQTILDAPERADHDLSSLRFATTGAAIVPVVLMERMQAELGFEVVVTAYGLTETSGFVSTCLPGDDDVTVATTCGRAIEGMEMRLSEQGELLVRGPLVMKGYLDDPEATAQTIDPDGWLHTGDVGTIDEQGYLRITDRLKDMYISGGFNVYPAEVEQALARLDGVVESAVIGVPDHRLGEVGRAFVRVRPGSALTADDVIAYSKEKLAGFKVPRSVVLVDEFPRNAGGKILKRELRRD